MRSKLFKKLALFLSTLSCSVIVFSPLSMAKEVQNQRTAAIKQILDEMGVTKNKKLTYGEMWNNVRYHFPPDVQAQLDVIFAYSRNEVVPAMKLNEVKVKGETVPRLTFQVYGQTMNIELYGDDDNVLKFNGHSLRIQDLVYGGKGFAALMKKDRVAQIDAEKTRQMVALSTQTIHPLIWKKLTPEKKAEFFIHFRGVVEATQKVLDLERLRQIKKGDKTKTSQLEKQLNQLMQLLAEPAEARRGREEPMKNCWDALSYGMVLVNKKSPDGKRVCQDGNMIDSNGAPATGSSDRVEAAVPSRGIGERGSNGIRRNASCIMAGYYDAHYDGNGGPLCGAPQYKVDPSQISSVCANSSRIGNITNVIACNPILYPAPGGGKVCAPYGGNDGQFATRDYCGKDSPITTPKDKEALVKALLINDKKGALASQVNLKGCDSAAIQSSTGGIKSGECRLIADSEDAAKAVEELVNRFNQAREESGKVCELIRASPSEFEVQRDGGKGQQQIACDEQDTRMLGLAEFLKDATVGGSGDGTCDMMKGLKPSETGPGCECVDKNAELQTDDKGKQTCVVRNNAPVADRSVKYSPIPTKTAEEAKKPWPWGLIGGITAAVVATGLYFWWLFSGNKRKKPVTPTYVDPVPPPPVKIDTSPVLTTDPEPILDSGASPLPGTTGGSVR